MRRGEGERGEGEDRGEERGRGEKRREAEGRVTLTLVVALRRVRM